MNQIEGWPKNHLSFLNFPPDFKSKQILIGQKQFFQCLHWLTAIQNNLNWTSLIWAIPQFDSIIQLQGNDQQMLPLKVQIKLKKLMDCFLCKKVDSSSVLMKFGSELRTSKVVRCTKKFLKNISFGSFSVVISIIFLNFQVTFNKKRAS